MNEWMKKAKRIKNQIEYQHHEMVTQGNSRHIKIKKKKKIYSWNGNDINNNEQEEIEENIKYKK